jgi:hypothetical protein
MMKSFGDDASSARGGDAMRLAAHVVLMAAVLLVQGLAGAALAQRSTPVEVLHPSGLSSDQFGRAVAIDGDTMIVGAPTDDIGANTDQGSAHIYRWNGTGWSFEATLTAAGGAASDQFG